MGGAFGLAGKSLKTYSLRLRSSIYTFVNSLERNLQQRSQVSSSPHAHSRGPSYRSSCLAFHDKRSTRRPPHRHRRLLCIVDTNVLRIIHGDCWDMLCAVLLHQGMSASWYLKVIKTHDQSRLGSPHRKSRSEKTQRLCNGRRSRANSTARASRKATWNWQTSKDRQTGVDRDHMCSKYESLYQKIESRL